MPETVQRVEVSLKFYDAQAIEATGWSCRADGDSTVACSLQVDAIKVPEAPQGASLAFGVLAVAFAAWRRARKKR